MGIKRDSSVIDKNAKTLEEEINYFLDSEMHIRRGIKAIFSVIPPNVKDRYNIEKLFDFIVGLTETEPATFDGYKFDNKLRTEYLWFVQKIIKGFDKTYIEKGIRMAMFFLEPKKRYEYDTLKLFYVVSDMWRKYPKLFGNHGFEAWKKERVEDYVDIVLDCMGKMKEKGDIFVARGYFWSNKIFNSETPKRFFGENDTQYREKLDYLLGVVKNRLPVKPRK